MRFVWEDPISLVTLRYGEVALGLTLQVINTSCVQHGHASRAKEESSNIGDLRLRSIQKFKRDMTIIISREGVQELSLKSFKLHIFERSKVWRNQYP